MLDMGAARHWRHTFVIALHCVSPAECRHLYAPSIAAVCVDWCVQFFVCVRLNEYRFFACVTLFLYIICLVIRYLYISPTAAGGCQWRETSTSAFIHTLPVKRLPALLCFKYQRWKHAREWGNVFLNCKLIFSNKAIWYVCFRYTYTS